MAREIIEIRSNISSTLEHIEQLMKEKAEKEKAEREAKWAKERAEREEKEKVWKATHPILDKFTYMSYYNYETYSWMGDYINVKFYEWSNINSEPRNFPYSIAFYKFLDECKLNWTNELNNKLKASINGCFITCIPGTRDLILAKNYESLKSQYNLAISTSKVLETVPEIPSENNMPVVINSGVYNGPMQYA